MKRLLLVADEEEYLLEPYLGLDFPLAWVGRKQQYTEALRASSEFVLQDPSADLAALSEIRALCAKNDLEIFYVAATSEENVPWAVQWAEALGVRGPCPPHALDFFYDKLEMRRRMGDHPWNVESWSAADLTGLDGGPFIVKPRRGQSSVGVQSCADREAVEACVSNLPDRNEWIVERKIPGPEYVLDGFLFDGVFRLTGLHRTFTGGVIEGITTGHGRYANAHIETAYLSGPLLPKAQALAMAETLGALFVSQGLREGMFHTELRMDGDQPKIVETHPRPGGADLPLMGELTGCPTLVESFARFLREEPAPPVSWPSSWVYQRFTKGLVLDDAARARLAEDCPGISFESWTPSSLGPVVAQTGDWDLCIRFHANTRARIDAAMPKIEAAVVEATPA